MPVAANGSPSRRINVGVMLPIGLLPPAGSFAPGLPVAAFERGVRLKSVRELLSWKPEPGTVIPVPNESARVDVITTALPHRSITEVCVVCPTSSDAVT